jgi:uncharacterized membrane protein (UPF0127 family)
VTIVGLLKNALTGMVIATRVDRADSFIQRAFGLLARPRVRPDEGLWIEHCSAIHTVGMRSSIDVIFVDDDRRVVQLERRLAPFRIMLTSRNAHSVIELGAGALELSDVLIGDQLELV